jgi:hypothetical protein
MKWVQATKWVLGIGVVVCLVAIAALWIARPTSVGPSIEARVVRFGTNPSRWRPERVTVVASTANGITGHGDLSMDQLEALHCKVGDTVTAHMVGSVLVVDAASCGKSK